RECGVSVRPGRVEIHVDGKRTGPPHGNCCKHRPTRMDILAGNARRENDSEKAIESGAKSHGYAIWRGKSIGGNLRSKCASEQRTGVSNQQERRPQNCGSDSEVIIEVAGVGAKLCFG